MTIETEGPSVRLEEPAGRAWRLRVDYSVGQGFDLHRLESGRRLMLGGVEIPAEKGCIAHSDGDVLLHALTDAVLGAAGQGDIGELFPDTDPAHAGRDSADFLGAAVQRAAGEGWRVVHADATVVAEAPKLSPYKERMRLRIAGILGCEAKRVNVKAKTNERVDAVGRGEAIAAQAVVLLERERD